MLILFLKFARNSYFGSTKIGCMVNNDNLMLQNRAKGANYVSSAFYGKCLKIMPVPKIMLAQSINACSRQRVCPFQLSLFVSAFYFRPNQLLES